MNKKIHFYTCILKIKPSPVDQVEVRGQAVGLEVAEESRKILLKENLEGGEILQHLEQSRETGQWVPVGFCWSPW